MKAELKVGEMQQCPSISLILETEEEKRVLANLWDQDARLVMLEQVPIDGGIQLIIVFLAPLKNV